MKLVIVDTDKKFIKDFEEAFKLTHRVTVFQDMLEAYKWMKADENIPEVIIMEMDFNQSTGLQSLKFLLSKSKLKGSYIVGFTHHELNENEKNLILSEGASSVFEKKELIQGLSGYLKYLSDPTVIDKKKSPGETPTERGKSN